MKAQAITTAPLNRLAGWSAFAGLLLGVVMQAPASWLSEAVASATQQRVLLLNPQGTVWQGSAEWALSDGQHTLASAQDASTHKGLAVPTRLASRMQWQIGPSIDFQTVAVGLKLELQSACCTNSPLQVFAAPTWKGLHLSSPVHTSQWPATWLVGLGAPWNTLQPEGHMQLRTQGLQWQQPWSTAQTQPQLKGEVELQWLQFSTRLSTLRPLGNYRVVVKGGDTMQVTLDTLEGSLQLQGRGEWQQGRLRFRGEAKAQTDAEAAVSNLLNVLGQRRGNVSFMELG
jgi:general secretion pathway protein N